MEELDLYSIRNTSKKEYRPNSICGLGASLFATAGTFKYSFSWIPDRIFGARGGQLALIGATAPSLVTINGRLLYNSQPYKHFPSEIQ